MQLPQSVQQFNHMTPLKTECNAETYSFGKLDRRQVVADFSGGPITIGLWTTYRLSPNKI